MSKFCNNCGSVMEDDAVFCTNCGAQDVPVYQDNPVEQPTGSPIAFFQNVMEDSKKKMIVLIAAGAALVVALLVLILAFSSSPKKAMKNLEKVMNGNASKISSLAPGAYWNYLKEEEDITKADVKDEFKDSYEDMKEYLEDEYGKNAKYSMKIADKDKLSKKKLEALAESIEENYEIDEKKVKAAYELEVEVSLKGREDDSEYDSTMYAVKIGGKWYIVGPDGTFFPDSYI